MISQKLHILLSSICELNQSKVAYFRFPVTVSTKEQNLQFEQSRLAFYSYHKMYYLIMCVMLCLGENSRQCCRAARGLGAQADARLLLLWTAGMWETRRVREKRQTGPLTTSKGQDTPLTWFSVKQEARSRYYVAALWVPACGSERATM